MLQRLSVCHEVIPVKVEIAIANALEETYEIAIDDAFHRAVQKSSMNHGPVDPALCLALQVFVPNAIVQSVKGVPLANCTLRFGGSRCVSVNFIVDPCSRLM